MSNHNKILATTVLGVIVAVHMMIALLTPQKWVLLPALMYAIAALAIVWNWHDD